MTTFASVEKTEDKTPIIKVAELEHKCFDILKCEIRNIHSEKYGDSDTAVCRVKMNDKEYVGFFRQTAIVNTLDRIIKNGVEFPLTDVTVTKQSTKNGMGMYWMLTAFEFVE